MSSFSQSSGGNGLSQTRDQGVGSEFAEENGGMQKYRLTFMFAVTMVIAIAIAAFTVNVIIGRLAETHLIRIAQQTTVQNMGHVESMMQDPMLMAPGGQMDDHASSGGHLHGGQEKPDATPVMPLSIERLLGSDGLSANYSAMVGGMNIEDFVLLNLDGKVLWSADLNDIGVTKQSNPMFIEAAAGGVQSALVIGHEEDHSHAADLRNHSQVLKTFLPLRESPTGPVIGVIEVDRDVAADVALQVDDAKAAVLLATTGTLGALFIVLLGFI